jgi:hypothetical protein
MCLIISGIDLLRFYLSLSLYFFYIKKIECTINYLFESIIYIYIYKRVGFHGKHRAII